MKKFLFFLFLPSICFSQTCVILKATKKALYVGADSRGTIYRLNNDIIDTIPVTICKIRSTGNYNFVSIGSFSDISIRLGDSICRSRLNGLDNVTISFNKKFIGECLSLISSYQRFNPRYFNKIVSDSIMSQTIFFGFENDSITINHLAYWATEESDGRITVHSKLMPIGSAAAAGEINSIRGLLDDKRIWRKGIVKGIVKLIKIAAKAEPKTISEPIDIIKVSREGTFWIRKKQGCGNSSQ